MIILRTKTYSDENQPASSHDLLIEQMKMQRALMETQKKRQTLQAQETRARSRAQQQQQRINQQKSESISKSLAKVAKETHSDDDETHLYKRPSDPVPPVPMKI